MLEQPVAFQLSRRVAALTSPFPVVPPLFPPFKQLNPLPQLLSRRLIDTAPGARDQFCIEFSMIDAAISGDGTDEQPVKIP